MNPLQIAKEAIGIVSNAGLKKDVIDLFEKKVGLLAEENVALTAEVASLKRKLADLEQEIEKLRPMQGELEEAAVKLLQLLSNPVRTPSLEQMARELGIKQVVAQYHADTLVEKGLIEPSAFVPGTGMMYVLTPKGTAHVVKNKLV